MSSFKENFERGDKEQLDYDDSAFYYFGLAMLMIVLIPCTYIMLIKPVFFGDISLNYSIKNCKCEICQKKMRERAKVYAFTWFNKWYALKFIVLAIMWVGCF